MGLWEAMCMTCQFNWNIQRQPFSLCCRLHWCKSCRKRSQGHSRILVNSCSKSQQGSQQNWWKLSCLLSEASSQQNSFRKAIARIRFFHQTTNLQLTLHGTVLAQLWPSENNHPNHLPVRRPGFHLHPGCNATGQRRYLSMVQWKKKTPAAGPYTPKKMDKIGGLCPCFSFSNGRCFQIPYLIFRGYIWAMAKNKDLL